MIDSYFDNLLPENAYHGDPSLPYFKYEKVIRDQKLKELIDSGVPDDVAEAQITQEEIIETNKRAQAQFEQEQIAYQQNRNKAA